MLNGQDCESWTTGRPTRFYKPVREQPGTGYKDVMIILGVPVLSKM